MKAPSALQRGMACLCCRKRKMKCDGTRPVCTQCSRASRAAECQYYEKKRTSRTQLLQAKLTKLEARLRELEAEQSPPEASSSSSSSSVSHSPQSDPFAHHQELGLASFSELDHEYFFGHDDNFNFDEDPFVPDLSNQAGVTWPSDFPHLHNDLFAPSPSNSSLDSVHDSSAGPSTNWWENDVFCQNKQILLDIFFAHRYQCAFDVHMGRYKTALLLPSAQKPHSSLLDAIYLLGCYFSRSPAYTALESHFLKRSLRGIADALQNSDRIVHVLQASCLLAVYFFWHGRTLEGYYHSSISARLAVGLGLHQIQSREYFQFQVSRAGYHTDAPAPLKASVPLSPPHDEVEYAERIAAFWQIFAVDRAWAVATGLPTALPDDEHPRSRIETIYPIPVPDDPEPTIENGLIQPFQGSHLSGSSASIALRVKAVKLFELTARCPASSAGRDESHYSLELSLTQFLRNLSDLGSAQHYSYMFSDVDLAAMQTLIYAATIHLHRDALEIDQQSYQKCLWAANAMATLIRQLPEDDYEMLCPIISTCWRSAADVYIRVLATSPQLMIEQQLDAVVAALQHLGRFFAIAGIYAAKVQEDRASPRQPLVPAMI